MGAASDAASSARLIVSLKKRRARADRSVYLRNLKPQPIFRGSYLYRDGAGTQENLAASLPPSRGRTASHQKATQSPRQVPPDGPSGRRSRIAGTRGDRGLNRCAINSAPPRSSYDRSMRTGLAALGRLPLRSRATPVMSACNRERHSRNDLVPRSQSTRSWTWR